MVHERHLRFWNGKCRSVNAFDAFVDHDDVVDLAQEKLRQPPLDFLQWSRKLAQCVFFDRANDACLGSIEDLGVDWLPKDDRPWIVLDMNYIGLEKFHAQIPCSQQVLITRQG